MAGATAQPVIGNGMLISLCVVIISTLPDALRHHLDADP